MDDINFPFKNLLELAEAFSQQGGKYLYQNENKISPKFVGLIFFCIFGLKYSSIMAAAKIIIVKESLSEIKALLRKSSNLVSPRLRMLIEIKKHENKGISKRDLADLIGVNHNSIQTWRKLYLSGGIELLCSHKMKGNRPSVFSKEEYQFISNKLNESTNGLRGYKELLVLLEKEFNKTIKYNTLVKYCIKNFNSKIKVARKSHIKKDVQALETFKKTSD